MTATADLSVVADAIERLRSDTLTPAACARATGHAISTFSRDRADRPAIDWYARDLLLIARAHPELAALLRAYLDGRAPEVGAAADLPDALKQEVRASATVAERIRDALADGQWRRCEIDLVIDAVRQRQRRDAVLMRDLRAAARSAKP
jgi:hypothetical protein